MLVVQLKINVILKALDWLLGWWNITSWPLCIVKSSKFAFKKPMQLKSVSLISQIFTSFHFKAGFHPGSGLDEVLRLVFYPLTILRLCCPAVFFSYWIFSLAQTILALRFCFKLSCKTTYCQVQKMAIFPYFMQGPLITDGQNSCKWTYH